MHAPHHPLLLNRGRRGAYSPLRAVEQALDVIPVLPDDHRPAQQPVDKVQVGYAAQGVKAHQHQRH